MCARLLPPATAIAFLFLVCCAHAVKDGFNLYKDLLRGKGDEVVDVSEAAETVHSPKLLYFYRTPLYSPSGDGLDKHSLTDIGKRISINTFKNLMLTRDLLDGALEDEDPNHTKVGRVAVPVKRGPGSIITWALSTNRPLIQSDIRQV